MDLVTYFAEILLYKQFEPVEECQNGQYRNEIFVPNIPY